jgi:hypothetical protein
MHKRTSDRRILNEYPLRHADTAFVARFSFLWFAFLSTITLGQNVSVLLASGSGTPGGTVVLPIYITSTEGAQAASIQWSLIYSTDITGVTLSLGSSATVTKSLYCHGNLCVVFGLNREIISDGIIAIVTVRIASKPSTQSIPIQIAGVVVATPAGQSIPARSVSGTVSPLHISCLSRFLKHRLRWCRQLLAAY